MGGKPRPGRDADPYPLGLGDFVLAYAYAKRWLTVDGRRLRSTARPGRSRTRAAIRKASTKAAADRGVRQLAKLRGLEKLPRKGSRTLHRQLQGALETVWDRWRFSRTGDRLANKAPLPARWHDYVCHLVRDAFSRPHYIGTHDDHVVVQVQWPHTIPMAYTTRPVTASGYPKPGAVYTLAVTPDWYGDVYKRGLARVRERLVLTARAIQPAHRDLADTADEVFDVTYVEKGHGYQLFLQDGIAARIDNLWVLVPYATEGALQHSAVEVDRAYKTAHRRLRKVAFARHRRAKSEES